jgi:hypothetical protein
MRRIRRIGIIWVVLFFQDVLLRAESSLDVLDDELKQAKQHHEDATSSQFVYFMGELDKAIQSPDAAIDLYQQAGGDMPDPAKVVTSYASETPDEKAQRGAQDDAARSSLAYVVQMHCGLMHFGALFVENPDQKGLHEAWISWLKSAAQTYPQVGHTPDDTRLPPPQDDLVTKDDRDKPVHKPRKRPPAPDKARDFKDRSLKESIITTFLGFNGWGDKDQGQWRVRDVPKLYRAEVLDPLRDALSPATLTAWDTYIAMRSSDQPDRDKWDQVDYPGLQFERSCDDYTMKPSTEKLATLVALIKAYPTYPNLDDWITRVHQMVDDYRAKKNGGTPPPAKTTTVIPGGPTVTVTTTTAGDATIITTTTNAPPPTPTPPKP